MKEMNQANNKPAYQAHIDCMYTHIWYTHRTCIFLIFFGYYFAGFDDHWQMDDRVHRRV